jgi:ElaA protein
LIAGSIQTAFAAGSAAIIDRIKGTGVKIAADISLEWRRWGELTAAQLYEVLQFRQAIFVVEQASPYPDLDGLDRAAEHLLLRRGDELVGYLRLVEPQPLVKIGRVAVKPEGRGRGLARLMMEAALQRANELYPHRDVGLSAQAYLEPFYRGLGFVVVSVPYDDCGVPHIDMIGPPRGA